MSQPIEVRAPRRRSAGDPRPDRPEREIIVAILAYLRTVPGVRAWRQNVGAVKAGQRFVRFGVKGLTDIAGWVGRPCPVAHQGHSGYLDIYDRPCPVCWGTGRLMRILAIEVKRPGVEPTPAQRAYLDLVRADGGIGCVASCVEHVVVEFRHQGVIASKPGG